MGILWVLAATVMVLGCKNEQMQSNSSGSAGAKPCVRVDPTTKAITPEGMWFNKLPEGMSAYTIPIDPKHIKNGKLEYSDEIDFGVTSVNKDGNLETKLPENAKQLNINNKSASETPELGGRTAGFCAVGALLSLGLFGGIPAAIVGGNKVLSAEGDKHSRESWLAYQKRKKGKKKGVGILAAGSTLMGAGVVGLAIVLICEDSNKKPIKSNSP